MIDLRTDGSLPDGAFNDDHRGTLDAVRGAVHPISNGPDMTRSLSVPERQNLREGDGRRRRKAPVAARGLGRLNWAVISGGWRA